MNIICKCKQPFVSSTLSVTRHLVVPSIINTTTNLLHFENHYVKQNNIKNHVIKLTNKNMFTNRTISTKKNNNVNNPLLTPVFSHLDYTVELPPTHTFPMHRYQQVYDAMSTYITNHPNNIGIQILQSRLADIDEITAVHSKEYVFNFSKNLLSDKDYRKIGFPFSYDFVRRTYRITGGSLSALEYLLDKKDPTINVAGNLAGGTHHAFAEHGEGYCIFNDIAVCTNFALHHNNKSKSLYNANRVIVLDFDVHQGNGTAAMLNNEPAAFTFSIHGDKNYPWKSRVLGDLDIGLEDDISDEEYLDVCKNSLDSVSGMLLNEPSDYYGNNSLIKEIIIYQAGVDALKSDRLGRLKLSRETLQKRNEIVYEWCKQRRNSIDDGRDVKVLITMGGGYSFPDINDSVECHVDVYAQANEMLN